MTVTTAKRAANRRNARKSTGPKSAAGKARSSRNATTHGIFCRDLVLPGEDQEIFDTLRHSFLFRLNPQDPLELSFVDRIVTATWKLRRLQLSESSMLHRQAVHMLAREEEEEDKQIEQIQAAYIQQQIQSLGPSCPREILDMHPCRARTVDEIPAAARLAGMFISDPDPIERLSRYEQRLELSIQRNLRALDRLRAETRKQSQSEDGAIPKKCPFLPAEYYELKTNNREEGKNDERGMMNDERGGEACEQEAQGAEPDSDLRGGSSCSSRLRGSSDPSIDQNEAKVNPEEQENDERGMMNDERSASDCGSGPSVAQLTPGPKPRRHHPSEPKRRRAPALPTHPWRRLAPGEIPSSYLEAPPTRKRRP